MSGTEGVAGLRAEIAAVDRRIAELFADRLRLARAVGALKREANLGAYAPAQEVSVYKRFRAAAGDDVPSTAADALARELISAALHAQRPIKVGCVGRRCGPAWYAAARAFGSMAEPRRVTSLASATKAVLAGTIDFLVAPLDGVLYELLIDSDLKICRRVELSGADAYAVVGRHASSPSGRDVSAVALLAWSGSTETIARLGPASARSRIEVGGDLVIEVPGHPDHGALEPLEEIHRSNRCFESCLVIGTWPLFPGETT